MRRESWAFALAFVVILGAGVALLGPRILARIRGPEPTPDGPTIVRTSPPDGATQGAPEDLPPAEREVPWRDIRIVSSAGPLRGGAWVLAGAEAEDAPGDAESATLRLRPTAERVVFSAPGHVQVEVAAGALFDGARVVLPVAAPPIRVRVTEADGRPAVGIPLLLAPSSRVAARTDETGIAVLDAAPPGRVSVDVGGRERAGPTLRLGTPHPQEATAVLEAPWTISGVVRTRTGAAVAGATVSAVDAHGAVGVRVTTADDGTFTWRGPLRSHVALVAHVPGRPPVHASASPPALGALHTEIGALVPQGDGGRLEGVLEVEDDIGPEAIRVEIEPEVAAVLRELFGPDAALAETRRVPVDAAMRFVAEDLPVDIPLRVRVRGAGLPLDRIVLLRSGERQRVGLQPAPGHRVTLRVVDTDGHTPVAGLSLHLAPPDAGGSARVVTTDAAGRVSVAGLARGAWTVRAWPSDRAAVSTSFELPRLEEIHLTLSDLLESPGISGRVLHIDGDPQPLAGVVVRAGGRETTTDADGAYVLDGLEGGVPVDVAYIPAAGDPTMFVPGIRRPAVPGEGASVDVVLPRAGRLRVRLLDGLTDEPLAFVHVVLRASDGDLLVDRAIAPRDGVVLLEGLRPGPATLTVLSGSHRHVMGVPLVPGEVHDAGEVRVGRGIRVTGRVVDAEDRPLGGALVGALDRDWARSRTDAGLRRELALRSARADEAGAFMIEGFDPRRPAVLAVWRDGFAPTARRVVLEDFQDDVHASVSVILRQGGRLEFELLESGSEAPISGALLDLEDARNGANYLDLLHRGMFSGPIASDRDWRLASAHFLIEQGRHGRYVVGPVEPGPYDVLIERPGYRPVRHRLSVLAPTDTLVDVVSGREAPLAPVPQTLEMVPQAE